MEKCMERMDNSSNINCSNNRVLRFNLKIGKKNMAHS